MLWRISNHDQPRQRKPVEDYLRSQGRFAHLFRPQRNTAVLKALQRRVDAYWQMITSVEGEEE